MPAPDWLTARAVAHRGLHDAAAGIIENMPAAITAAIDAGYGIEVDLQISHDGEAMVHHDDALGRLTEGSGRLATMTAAELARVPFRATAERMMTLADLLDLVAGRATLLLELKSRFDRDRRLPRRVAEVLRGRPGPVAVMSFDPYPIAVLAEAAPKVVRGVVAERARPQPGGGAAFRRALAYGADALRARPNFIAYSAKDLPAAWPLLAKRLFGRKLLTWTVRSEDERRRVLQFADQIIFEGFRPPTR